MGPPRPSRHMRRMIRAVEELRRVDLVRSQCARVMAMRLRRCGTRERVLPAEPIPVVDVKGEGQHVSASRDEVEAEGLCRRARGAALRGEELDHHRPTRGESRVSAERSRQSAGIDKAGVSHDDPLVRGSLRGPRSAPCHRFDSLHDVVGRLELQQVSGARNGHEFAVQETGHDFARENRGRDGGVVSAR